MALNQFCGCFAMIVYAATIFQKSGSNLSPINSSIIVGSIQIVGAICASMFVERAGRKFMMSISSFGIAIGFSSLGFYLYLQSIGMNLDGYSFIPLLAFSFAIFLGNLGVLTLPFMILNEISPPKVSSWLWQFSHWPIASSSITDKRIYVSFVHELSMDIRILCNQGDYILD